MEDERKSMYDLKLNEEMELAEDYCWIRRVPGGWIYEYEKPGNYSVAAVFVPYTAYTRT